MESLSLQADKGRYDYRPQRNIDPTEYKWQSEDIKPLTNSSTRCSSVPTIARSVFVYEKWNCI